MDPLLNAMLPTIEKQSHKVHPLYLDLDKL
jgi:hypothetical protein